MARGLNNSEQQITPAQAPDGFRRTGTANAVGWFHMGKVGNTLSGLLLGVYERKDQLRAEGTSKFFQVQLKQDCEVRVDRGEDAKIEIARAGSIVNVNYGPKTKGWEALVADIRRGAAYEVWAQISGPKVKIGAGKSMHQLEAFDKMVKPPTETADEADFEGGEDELPAEV